jgi:chemotaxis protein histidine kinase CheA
MPPAVSPHRGSNYTKTTAAVYTTPPRPGRVLAPAKKTRSPHRKSVLAAVASVMTQHNGNIDIEDDLTDSDTRDASINAEAATAGDDAMLDVPHKHRRVEDDVIESDEDTFADELELINSLNEADIAFLDYIENYFDAKAKAKAKAEAEAKAEAKTEAQAEAQAEAEAAAAAANTEANTEANAKAKVETETEPGAEAGAGVEVEPSHASNCSPRLLQSSPESHRVPDASSILVSQREQDNSTSTRHQVQEEPLSFPLTDDNDIPLLSNDVLLETTRLVAGFRKHQPNYVPLSAATADTLSYSAADRSGHGTASTHEVPIGTLATPADCSRSGDANIAVDISSSARQSAANGIAALSGASATQVRVDSPPL